MIEVQIPRSSIAFGVELAGSAVGGDGIADRRQAILPAPGMIQHVALMTPAVDALIGQAGAPDALVIIGAAATGECAAVADGNLGVLRTPIVVIRIAIHASRHDTLAGVVGIISALGVRIACSASERLKIAHRSSAPRCASVIVVRIAEAAETLGALGAVARIFGALVVGLAATADEVVAVADRLARQRGTGGVVVGIAQAALPIDALILRAGSSHTLSIISTAAAGVGTGVADGALIVFATTKTAIDRIARIAEATKLAQAVGSLCAAVSVSPALDAARVEAPRRTVCRRGLVAWRAPLSAGAVATQAPTSLGDVTVVGPLQRAAALLTPEAAETSIDAQTNPVAADTPRRTAGLTRAALVVGTATDAAPLGHVGILPLLLGDLTADEIFARIALRAGSAAHTQSLFAIASRSFLKMGRI